jgi:peroxiredoxin
VVLLAGFPASIIGDMSMRRLSLLPVLLLAVSLSSAAATPGVGQRAPDFTLSTPNGEQLTLSSLNTRENVVLIVLRGYPGYQCPFSQLQFQSYQQTAAQFAALGTQVVFVYPGANNKNLADDAKQMMGATTLPANVHVVLDPDYHFTTQYGLRWDAANQTAYPSTFLLAKGRFVFFAHTGHTSSDQTPPADALAALTANTSAKKD